MKKFLLSIALLPVLAQAQMLDTLTVKKIFNEALTSGQAYPNLRYLCKTIGPRLSGSANAQKAVEWGQALMTKYGFDTVYLQPVMVPHWVRGRAEKAYMVIDGKRFEVPVAALGGSIATPEKGIQAGIIEVKSLDDVKKLKPEEIKGKIIFYNGPMNPENINPFMSYGAAVGQRGRGAIEAAKLGAVAAIVRSMTTEIDNYPHTGAMRYDDAVAKIPAACISTLAAEQLSSALKTKAKIEFLLIQNCETLPDVPSYNVVGEIRGSLFPKEIITCGGHLDSWDLAEGAHDDGAGVVQSIEALRLIKSLGIKPKRTIRAVLFMNEENGLRGGVEYAEQANALKENHIAALETDEGGFSPRGFGIACKPEVFKKFEAMQPFWATFGLGEIHNYGGGADIGPLEKFFPNMPMVGLYPDAQRYFDVHHTALDVFELVNRRELHLGAASMAAMLYVISEQGM